MVGRGSRFNDPFDCNHHIDIERTDEEWEEYIGRGLDKGREFVRSKVAAAKAALTGEACASEPAESREKRKGGWRITFTDDEGRPVSTSYVLNRSRARSLQRTLKRLDEVVGVLCLSHDPDNILLWSHYANRHDGICLQFDVAGHPDAFPRLHPVTYQAEALDLDAPFQDLFDVYKGEPKLLLDVAALMRGGDPDREGPARQIERWVYTKGPDWAYETEWRALTNKPGLGRFPARALTGVIVGCVNTEANLALVREAIHKKRPRPKVYVATKQSDRFGVDIEVAV